LSQAFVSQETEPLSSLDISLSSASKRSEVSLVSLFLLFLKIGSLSFGGFMALVSVVEREVVQKRKLLAENEIIDGISLASVLPGPLAVNLVAYVGYRLKGFLGALVTAFAVIFPSYLLILLLSYFYFTYGDIPAVQDILSGLLPAIVAIILVVGLDLFKKNVKQNSQKIITALAATVLIFVGGFFTTLALIVIFALLGRAIFFEQAVAKKKHSEKSESIGARQILNAISPAVIFFILVVGIMVFSHMLPAGFFGDFWKLLITFSGMSVSLFGGGYVFIPMMQEAVVTDLGWLSEKEFIDAIAMGQITPGPIMISATFIGYKVAGVAGSALATAAIFFPPALLMVLCSRAVSQIADAPGIEAAYMGMRPCVVGMILAAAFILAMSVPINLVTTFIFILSMLLIVRFKISVLILIPGAALVGGLAGYLL